MSITDVTRRFLACLDKLAQEGKVRSKRQFALELGYHAQGISEMTSGRRDVPIELLEKAIAAYCFNPTFLFTGRGEPFCDLTTTDQGLKLHHLTVITDPKGDERIVHVPCQAQAGYGKSLHDPVYLQDLPSYQLPHSQFKSGTYRSFEIAGTSMQPSFHAGDIAIAAFVESRFWEQAIKNHQVYIVVTEEEVLIKRLINQIRTSNIIECLSDNPEFDAYTLRVHDIREIWKVRMKLTTHFEQPHMYNSDISKQLMMQQKMLQSLQDQFARSTA